MQPVTPSEVRPASRWPWPVWALIGCSGCIVAVLLVLLVGGGALFRFGTGIFTEQVEAEMRGHPMVVEHLGVLEDFDIDLGASNALPGENDFVFEARGSKGTGRLELTCITVDAETEEVVAGTLQLASGEVIDLFPEEGPQVD